MREGGPTQHAQRQLAPAEHLRNDLRHAEKTLRLDAFGGAHQQLWSAKERRHRLIGLADMLRWDRANHNAGAVHGQAEIRGCGHPFGDTVSRQICHVLSPLLDHFCDRRGMRPKNDGMIAAAAERESQRRSP